MKKLIKCILSLQRKDLNLNNFAWNYGSKSDEETSDNEFFNGILNATFLGICIKDVKNGLKYTYWNEIMKEITGYSSEQVIGKDDYEIGLAEATLFRKKDLELIQSGGNISFRYTNSKTNKDKRQHFLANLSLLKQGDNSYHIMTLADITTLTDTEEILRQSEKEISVALTAGGLSSWRYDIPSKKFSSSHKNEIIGAEVSFEQLENAIHPEDKEMFDKMFDKIISKETEYNETKLRIIDTNGNIRWFDVHSVPDMQDENGNIIRLLGSQREITKELKTEQEIEEGRMKIELALSAGNLIPWEYDIPNQTLHLASDNNQINTSIQEYLKFIHPDDLQLYHNSHNKLLSGEIDKNTQELRYLIGDNYRWFQYISIVSQKDSAGNILKITGFSLDITDAVAKTNELIYLRNLAEESSNLKSAFLANMSHEIRTPLNAIIGFSAIIAETDDEQEKADYLNIIKQNNDLLLNLVNDVLDVSKIETGKYEFIDSIISTNDILKNFELMFSVRATEGVHVILDKQENEILFIADINRISQVLTNLLSNAIKFTTSGYVKLGCFKDNEYLYFYVKDTGIGISEENLPFIFDRFFKLSSFTQGTGLGLSISKLIIEHMGGEIGVESKFGEGSKFWFKIPHIYNNEFLS